MFETLDRVILAGLGALNSTKKMAKETFDEYVREGQAQRKGRKGPVEEVVKSVKDVRKELGEFVDRQTQNAIKRLNLVSKDELTRVEAKLDRLLKSKPKPKSKRK